jgi:hypothetical protein
VWVSAYIGLAELETAARANTDLVAPAAARLYEHAVLGDLPEFLAWALVYQAESGDHAKVPLARRAAAGIANPVLQARVQALSAGEPYRQSGAKGSAETPARRRVSGATA